VDAERRVAALNKFPNWLVRRGWIVPAVVGVWYVAAWAILGWSDAWDVLVGRATPRNGRYPWVEWPLSVLGWILVPAFIGAVTGYLLNADIEKRRHATEEEIDKRIEKRLREGGHE
jgi:hypothetical protein